jgi:transcription antitermination factor NusG
MGASLTRYEGRDLCPSCYVAAKRKWFAVATWMSDSKVKSNIVQSIKKSGQYHKYGKIVIPKASVTKKTQNSWEVIDIDGKVVGNVSAPDHATALYDAKIRFGRPRKKTLYKPQPQTDEFKELRKVKEKGKVVYEAISTENRVMGRLWGAKNPKHALEMATKLYVEPKQNNNPREAPVQQHDVYDVRLAKHGGKVKTQNARSMTGYILIQCDDDADLFDTINRTKGVIKVLPYSEKLTEKEFERMVSHAEKHGGSVIPDPTPIDVEEIEAVTKPIEKMPKLEYKEGDVVQIIGSGTFTGMHGRVKAVTGDKMSPIVQIEVMIWSRPVVAKVSYLDVRSA